MADPNLVELDVFLWLLIAQIARHQRQTEASDADWVSMSSAEALSHTIGHRTARPARDVDDPEGPQDH